MSCQSDPVKQLWVAKGSKPMRWIATAALGVTIAYAFYAPFVLAIVRLILLLLQTGIFYWHREAIFTRAQNSHACVYGLTLIGIVLAIVAMISANNPTPKDLAPIAFGGMMFMGIWTWCCFAMPAQIDKILEVGDERAGSEPSGNDSAGGTGVRWKPSYEKNVPMPAKGTGNTGVNPTNVGDTPSFYPDVDAFYPNVGALPAANPDSEFNPRNISNTQFELE